MEVSEKQLDTAIEGISEAICTVAYAVLDEADAYMFLDELDKFFGELNRVAELDELLTERDLSDD